MANISKIKLPSGGLIYDLKDNSAVPKYGLGENILDNWYFPDPVNQRGQNSYSISSIFTQDVYTIDRWKITGSYFTVSLTSSGLELTKTNNITSAHFSQHVPKLDTNQDYTFSAIINGELCTATGRPGSTSSIATYTINNVTFDMRFTSYGSGRYEVQFVFPINEEGTITIKAVKFEVGTEQTLIQTRSGNLYLTENPDYGKELLNCQTSIEDSNDPYANKSFIAEDINYDNSSSSLNATDVQSAIDEVVTDLGSKQSTITVNGILKGNGQGGVTAATAGTDYATPDIGVYYGRCQTAATTAAKEVSITGVTSYYAGLHIRVRFDNAQEAKGTVTLNVNGLGALQLRTFASTSGLVTVGEWRGATVLDIEYQALGDGYWLIVNGPHATTDTYGRTILSSSISSSDTDKAATPSAVKEAYDLANSRVPIMGRGINLLHNWYFAGGGTGPGVFPVNQRQVFSVTSNSMYFIDRWRAGFIDGYSCSLTSAGIVTTNSSSTAVIIYQTVDNYGKQLLGKQVTCSIQTTAGTYIASGTIPSTFDNSGLVISVRDANSNIIGGLNVSSSDLQFRLRTPGNLNVTFVAAKLELGNRSTLVINNVLTEIPDYDEELLKCQTAITSVTDIYANKIVSVNTPNPNLLDNWYFVGGGSQGGSNKFPINQRGLSAYSTNGFCIDRWTFTGYSGGTLTLNSDGVTLTKNTATASPGVQQNFDFDLENQVITFSLLTATGVLYTRTVGPLSKSTSGWQLSYNFSVFWVGLRYQDNCWNLYFTVANQLKIAAVKLELGTQQTLARSYGGTWVLNEIPNYIEEYNKCRHYLRVFPSSTPLVVRMDWNTATISYLQLDPPMYKTPSVTFTSTAHVGCNGSNSQVASMTSDSPNRIKITTNGSLTVKSAASLACNGTLTVSAEL